jgi:RHS repeat-associated protein
MSYSYDNVGNTKFINETINGTIEITTSQQYDALNRLTQNIQGMKRIDYIYNALGQVTNKKRYADIQGTMFVAETNHTYDSLNRLTNITHSKGANTIASYTQSYDAGSKITGITSSADGSSTYTYDKTDQLTGADYNYQTDENYTYDANGNRTNTGYVTGVNNQLLSDSKYSYGYDAVGNRSYRIDKITNEVTYYSWDVRDRLTGINVYLNGQLIRTANYIYDVYDQRIAKIVDLDGDGLGAATTERFVYGSNQNIALVFDGNGTLTHRYLFANGIDQIEADEQITTGTTLWALTDHLGSVRDVVDNSGVNQNHIVYDAFGNITSQTNSSVIFKFGYTARELDTESRLQYNRGRFLIDGRFISEDKSGFGGGDANLYRYVFNSPTNLVDPLGNQGVIRSPLVPVTPIFPRLQDNQNLPRIPGYPGSPNSTDSLLIQLEDRLGDVGKGLSRFIPSIFPFTGKPPEKDDELKGGTKPKPSPTLNPPPIRKPTPEPDEEPIPFLLPKAPNPNSCECEKSKRETKPLCTESA